MQPSAGGALSVVIVAHNEESRLAACLESCAFADEIVVLLDRCTDGSRAIAQAAGATLLEGAWPVEGDRRTAAIAAARHEWILEIDADERVTPELALELRAFLPAAKPGCYRIPFLNCIGGRPVKYGWGGYVGTGSKWALFTRGYKIWSSGQSVHPELELRGARGALRAPIVHFVDDDIADLFKRINRYSDLAAEDLARTGRAGSSFTAWRRFFSRALKSYVQRAGFREGYYGAALALAAGLYPLWTHLKAKELLDRRTLTPES